MRKSFILTMIFSICISFLNIHFTSAGAFQSVTDKYYKPTITEKLQQLSFKEGADSIIFMAKKTSKTTAQFAVAYNNPKSILYDINIQKKPMYGRIYQIFDKNSGRYFYIVSIAQYPDGGRLLMQIMGMDPSTGKWHTYVNADDYYHPSEQKESWIFVNKAGDLILDFSDGSMGLAVPTQRYTFQWNNSTQKFDYIDEGFSVHR